MEAIYIGIVVLGAVFAFPVIVFIRLAAMNRRVEALEREVARLRSLEAPASAPAPELAAAPPGEPAAVIPSARPAPGPAPPPPAPVLEPAAASPAPGPPPPGLTSPHAPPARLDASGLEQLVGGIWLQNLGSVVLLLGVFLMIVWGYTTHRFGPQVLVAGGVAFGLALAWRGDRLARRTPRFGHALIGLGLGVVYLTLYLGYIRLHVLGAGGALALLALVSFGAIATGLRYRVQAIAAFGVIGAFLPQFMARWLGLPGYEIAPPFLLGYLATIDLLVFALAARAGWSGLDLAAILLSAATWLAAFGRPEWGWPVQAGLAALFTVLGLAPLPRLVRVEGRVRSLDLAVVAVAPLAMLAASAPFLSWADRGQVAMLLFTLALVMLCAALWVDAHRPERDLWVPLTAAAALFVTAALERAIGPTYTALAWMAEGVVLLLLGLRARGGWLRAMGHLVLAAGTFALLERLNRAAWASGAWWFSSGSVLRDLACIVALLTAAGRLRQGRAHLVGAERHMAGLWTVVGHALLAWWFSNEARHLTDVLTEPGGRFQPLSPPVGISLGARRDALATGFSAVAWLAQATVLAWRGTRGTFTLRVCAAALGLLALLTLAIRPDRAWWTDLRPFVHAAGLLDLLAVALMAAVALRFASERARLQASERRWGEAWATAASLLLMLWSVRETRHLAQSLLRPELLAAAPVAPGLLRREHALGAAFASVAWLVQAVALLVLGWVRDSAFLRWSGLTLLGLTLFKFLVFDLQTVDVFWRFLTAIAVGAAMLAFSYAYQRRSRATRAKD